MNGYLNIQVRLSAGAARTQLAGLQAQMAGLGRTTAGVAATPIVGRSQTSALTRWGNQLQWTGRQLQRNFTFPILLAAGAATKFALDQETAMTHVAKVYGDTTAAAEQFRKENSSLSQEMAENKAASIFAEELGALDKVFTALSEHYGEQKKDVLEVAGAWAAAGVSGVELARSVENSMRASVIGDMSMVKATEALISIQAQYNLDAEGLTETLANLNAIENATGADMQDLISAMQRTGSAARAGGVDARYLAAMVSALVPATGTATRAGNSLKTIFSRIQSPTKAATSAMRQMGLETESAGWASLSAGEKLQLMSDKFKDLDKSQKNAITTAIAGRWQYNRLTQLLEDMGRENGYFAKSLKATETRSKSLNTMTKELNTVLESNPRALKRVGVALQNNMADIIRPLVPLIISFAAGVASLVGWFGKLDPSIQKLVFIFLAFLVIMPLITIYIGSISTLFGVLHVAARTAAIGLGIFTVSTETATGATVVARGGLIRLAATMIKMPFVFLANMAGVAMGLAAKAIWGFIIVGRLAAQAFIAKVVLPIIAGFHALAASVVRVGFIQTFAAMWAAVISIFQVGGGAVLVTQGMLNAGLVRGELGASATLLAITSSRASAVLVVAAGRGTAEVAIEAKTAISLASIRQTLSTWLVSMYAAQNAAVNGIEAGGSATRLAIAGSSAAQMLAITEGVGLTRVFMAKAAAASEIAFEAVSAQARLFIVASGAAGEIGILEATGATRIGIASATTAAEITIVQLGVTARMAALSLYYRWVAFTETVTRVQQLAIASSTSTALLAIEASTAIARTIIVTRGGTAIIATEASTAVARTAIAARGGSAMLAIEASTAGGRTAIAAGGGTTRLAIEAGSGAARTAVVATAGAAQVAATRVAMLARAGVIVSFSKFILKYLIRAGAAAVVAFTGPWGWAIAAVLLLIYLFRNQLKGVWDSIIEYFKISGDSIGRFWTDMVGAGIRAFNALPQGVANAMIAVVTIVRDAALAVYEWFSYLNPWATHSPSLVDNVKTGMAAVVNSFSSLGKIKQYTDSAYGVLSQFGQATAKFMAKSKKASEAGDRALISKAAGRQAVAIYDRLIGKLGSLQKLYGTMGNQIKKMQEAITVPMGLMEDEIFSNDQAQKRLRLEMLKMGDVGNTIEDVQNKLAELNGEQESLRGIQSDLRGAGAGSEILSFYDDQITAVEQQKKALSASGSEIANMQKKMDELQRAGEILDLEKSLKFDGPLRDIDKMKEKFDLVGDAISAIRTQIQDVVSVSGAIEAAKEAARQAAKNAAGAGGGAGSAGGIPEGEFPIPGGKGLAIRKDWSSELKDIDKMIDDMLKDTSDKFGSLNPFEGLWPGWNKIWAKIKSSSATLGQWIWDHSLKPIGDFFVSLWTDYVKPELVAWWGNATVALDPLRGLGNWIWDNVLKPVWDFFADFFTSYILPVMDVWWNLMLVPLGVVAQLGIWFWEYVLKPVYDFLVSLWDDYVLPELSEWWERIKAAWNVLKSMGKWVWDNVLKPVWNFFVSLWTNYVKPELSKWWGGIKTAFNALLGLGDWIYDNVLKPVWDKFISIFKSIGGWIKNNTGTIVKPFKRMVNAVIGAINLMIRGLNMLDKLPLVDFNVSEIPPLKLAKGGAIPSRRVGNGWVTSGARAIVGEGKANHPEFVIPTDPTYRGRAISLFTSLGQKLGVVDNAQKIVLDSANSQNGQGIPKFAFGGVLGSIKDAAKGVGGTIKDIGGKAFDWTKGRAQDVATRIYAPIGRRVDALIEKIGPELRGGAQDIHRRVRGVVGITDDYMADVRKEYSGAWRKPLSGGYSIGGGIGSYPGHNGQDFPAATGTPVRAVTGGIVTTSRDMATSYGRHVEIQHQNGIRSLSAHLQSRSVSVGNSVNPGDIIGYSDSTGNSTGSHLHLSMWKNGALVSPLAELASHGVHMKNGGIVQRSRRGTSLLAGEGGQDEAVIPLPSDWRQAGLGGSTTTNNYDFGDATFEFPNISDPNDAQAFLDNLASVVKD